MTAGRLKEMAWGVKGAAVSENSGAERSMLRWRSERALAMAGEELLVVEENITS